MANERDFELLDDYLTNRMSEQDRSAFEQKLNADPDLQHEYVLQKHLIQGIKDARIAELKSMLNNVPVPPSGTGNAVATKIAIGTVMTLVIAGAAYWFSRDEQPITTTSAPYVESENNVPSSQEAEPERRVEEEKQSSSREQKRTETDRNQTSAGTEHSKPSLAQKPEPLTAPQGTKSNKAQADALDNQSSASNLVVETDADNSRYAFHYQLREGKLTLYGPFENNLYEVIEFSAADQGAVFLYHKDQYYTLNESGADIKPLTPVSDPTLLKKLTEYRTSN